MVEAHIIRSSERDVDLILQDFKSISVFKLRKAQSGPPLKQPGSGLIPWAGVSTFMEETFRQIEETR